jgi:NAD(P)-dependent dehydrogenase (short-subunit alcohol dehydrogenase family)
MPRFRDQVAIVTGAASGIGLAVARAFGSEGARVAIADLDPDKAELAALSVRAAGAPDAFAVLCDVADETQVTRACDAVIARWERLDVVVNNAGRMVFKPLVEHTREDWDAVLSVDLLGAFYFTREAFRRMAHGGAIVNVSSVHAVETTPLVSSYAAAKAALLSFTRSAAIEGKALGIRVNAVLPGAIDTPMLWNNPNIRSGLETIDTTDVGTPQDVAAAVLFLASEESRFVQGDDLRVDGGRLSRL